MKSSPELRPCLWDALVALLVVVLAAACALAVWNRGNDGGEMTAVVTVDGTEADRFSLTDAAGGERVYSGNGYTLHVRLAAGEDGNGPGLSVKKADCPTQDCVHTGTITRAGQSIVCLPARIIIRLEGGTVDQDAPDLVIG